MNTTPDTDLTVKHSPLPIAVSRMMCRARPLVFAALTLFAACVPLSGLAAPVEQDQQLMDEFIGKYVGPQGAPGAAAVMVHRDGRLTFRGYGVENLDTRTAVDPDRTIFRIGSITKSFTALAILQLVDEGRVDLMADANTYLKGVKIGGTQPIRVVDLLTHRSGFDSDLTFVGLDDAKAAANSTDERLQRDIFRLRPAGQIAVYDNMAWGLLGHIVESVDGTPYAQSIARRVFKPLGMTHSQIGLPQDPKDVASAYEVGEDGLAHLRPQTHLRRGWQGAGDASTTAADMSRFLQMMLSGGQYPGGRLLTPETFKRYTDTTQFRVQPEVSGTGLGVYSMGQRGGGAFGHGGTIRGFNALYMVMPGQDLGFFAVMNLNKAVPEMSLHGLSEYIAHPPLASALDPSEYLVIELQDLLGKRLQSPAAMRPPYSGKASADWSGRYANMRAQSYEGLLPRLAVTLVSRPREVRQLSDGSLQIGEMGPYRPVAADVYRLDKDAGPLLTELGFVQIGDLTVMAPHTLQANRRLHWYERPPLTVGGLLLVPVILLLGSLVHGLFFRSKGSRFDWFVAGLSLVVIMTLLLELALASSFERVEGHAGLVTAWRVLLNLALLGLAMGSAKALRGAWYAPAEASAVRVSRLHASVLAPLVIWLLCAASYWNVMGRF